MRDYEIAQRLRGLEYQYSVRYIDKHTLIRRLRELIKELEKENL